MPFAGLCFFFLSSDEPSFAPSIAGGIFLRTEVFVLCFSRRSCLVWLSSVSYRDRAASTFLVFLSWLVIGWALNLEFCEKSSMFFIPPPGFLVILSSELLPPFPWF